MNKQEKSRLIITSKVSLKSSQSRKYYERTFELEDLQLDKPAHKCSVQLVQQEVPRLQNFLQDYRCEEFYIEVPAAKLFFTSRKSEPSGNNGYLFHIHKEEKIAYPEKEKV